MSNGTERQLPCLGTKGELPVAGGDQPSNDCRRRLISLLLDCMGAAKEFILISNLGLAWRWSLRRDEIIVK